MKNRNKNRCQQRVIYVVVVVITKGKSQNSIVVCFAMFNHRFNNIVCIYIHSVHHTVSLQASTMFLGRKFVLKHHFVGHPKPEDFDLVEKELPVLQDGDIQFRASFLWCPLQYPTLLYPTLFYPTLDFTPPFFTPP